MFGPIMPHYRREAIPLNPGKSENQTSLLLPGNFTPCYFPISAPSPILTLSNLSQISD